MGAVHSPPRRNGVAFRDDFIDGVGEVGERPAEHPHHLLRAVPIQWRRHAGNVQLVVRAEQLVGRAQVPLVPEFVIPEAQNDILVVGRPVEALNYDFNLSKLERVMPKPWPCPGARLLSGFI